MEQHEAGWQCPKCGLVRKPDLRDPCLGDLPGVLFACCGHGDLLAGGYVYFESGVIIRGLFITERATDEQMKAARDMKIIQEESW